MSSEVRGCIVWMPEIDRRGAFGVTLDEESWTVLGANDGDHVIVHWGGNTYAAEVSRLADQRFVRVFADRDLAKGPRSARVRLARAA